MMTLILCAATAMAHCDAENGPVAVDVRQALAEDDFEAAEKALETGDIDPVTNMLSAEMKKKLTHVFENARKARQKPDRELT